jgi:hypothetical protein
MHQLSIEICNSREEAQARDEIIRAASPGANWVTRIVENIDAAIPFLVPDIGTDPIVLPPLFTPSTPKLSSPAVVLLVWTED